MPDAVGGEVSRQAFAVAYSGISRPEDHSIDVEALGPALIAFGRLIREANNEFNGRRATSRVLVASDFEHKCFHIDFDVIVSYYQMAKTILGADPISTAKEILEWIGLIKDNNNLLHGSATLLQFLKLRKGGKIVEKEELVDKDKTGMIALTVETGDKSPVTINVTRNIYQLGTNQKALKAVRDAFTPIGQDGFDTLQLREGDALVEEISARDTQAILASSLVGIEEAAQKEPEIEITTAWLSVYSPVYDATAKLWRFKIGRSHEYVDISETKIAEDALARGGSMADDAYQVRLEVSTPIDKDGKAGTPSYKILEVLKFIPASPLRQGSLFDGKT